MKYLPIVQYCLHHFLVVIIFMYTGIVYAAAPEEAAMKLVRYHIRSGEYHNAVTEAMRYQYMHPEGSRYPESMVLMGKAYFRGGNYRMAVNSLERCYSRYRTTPEGEISLYYIGHIRLVSGSPYYAYRTFQQYRYLYPNGIREEETRADMCYALALMNDPGDSRKSIEEYRREFPRGKFRHEMQELEKRILYEETRPKKSMWVAVCGSVAVPGFGHFYTGRYTLGVFTFFTNAALLYLFYDGYRDNDTLRMAVFGIAELSFYQHSLFSAVRNVYHYNSREKFYRDVQLGIRTQF